MLKFILIIFLCSCSHSREVKRQHTFNPLDRESRFWMQHETISKYSFDSTRPWGFYIDSMTTTQPDTILWRHILNEEDSLDNKEWIEEHVKSI